MIPSSTSRLCALLTPWLMRLGALSITLIIFLIDSLSSLDVAIAVLYIVVILIAVDLFSRRGVLLVAYASVALTLSAYVIAHGDEFWGPAFGRCLVSLAAIAIAGYLALKNKAGKDQLQEQVRLLHRSEAFLAGAQRLSQTGSLGLELPGTAMYWSDEARRIFEFDAGQQPSVHAMLERTHPQDRTLLRSIIDQADAGTVNLAAEFRLQMPDGRTKHVRMLAREVEDGAGHREYVGALMDVTTAKNAEEALHRSQSDLAHITRVTTLGELAASIAHEVNQPLAAVITNAEAGLRWLNREVPDIGEVRAAIERAKSQAHRASEVIRRIRALSRKTDPQNVSLDLPEVIEESIALVQREIQRQRVTLSVQIDEPLPAVRGDRIQLQQVIINLIMNAVQAMAASPDGRRNLHVHLRYADDEGVVLQIRDSGLGIDAQNMGSLFDPFFTTKANGMGMGLSICRSIIESHGGRIWADSEPGQGAVLSFALPEETNG
jgi:PAS domain S-box-containing protein